MSLRVRKGNIHHLDGTGKDGTRDKLDNYSFNTSSDKTFIDYLFLSYNVWSLSYKNVKQSKNVKKENPMNIPNEPPRSDIKDVTG